MTNDTNKIKLLVLWDILCKNTDENHAMNSDEIRGELAKRGISVMRKVVATDIAALNKYGYEVLSYKKKYYYYYVVSRPLETAEVVMLADVIKASKVINEALFYGLPILAEKICGDSVTPEERAALTTPRKSGSREEKFYAVVVQLLREAVLNVTINKSILSSLYHEKSEEIAKDRDRANRFDSGLMSDTPEYLERYEAEGIKKLRR